jgi:hypothetical protein
VRYGSFEVVGHGEMGKEYLIERGEASVFRRDVRGIKNREFGLGLTISGGGDAKSGAQEGDGGRVVILHDDLVKGKERLD